MAEYITKGQALQAFEKAENLSMGFSRLNLTTAHIFVHCVMRTGY